MKGKNRVTQTKLATYYYNKLYESYPEYNVEDIYIIINTRVYKQLPVAVTRHIGSLLQDIYYEEYMYGIDYVELRYKCSTKIDGNSMPLVSDLEKGKDELKLFTISNNKFEDFYMYYIETLGENAKTEEGNQEIGRGEVLEGDTERLLMIHDSLMFYLEDSEVIRKYRSKIIESLRKIRVDTGEKDLIKIRKEMHRKHLKYIEDKDNLPNVAIYREYLIKEKGEIQ